MGPGYLLYGLLQGELGFLSRGFGLFFGLIQGGPGVDMGVA